MSLNENEKNVNSTLDSFSNDASIATNTKSVKNEEINSGILTTLGN